MTKPLMIVAAIASCALLVLAEETKDRKKRQPAFGGPPFPANAGGSYGGVPYGGGYGAYGNNGYGAAAQGFPAYPANGGYGAYGGSPYGGGYPAAGGYGALRGLYGSYGSYGSLLAQQPYGGPTGLPLGGLAGSYGGVCNGGVGAICPCGPQQSCSNIPDAYAQLQGGSCQCCPQSTSASSATLLASQVQAGAATAGVAGQSVAGQNPYGTYGGNYGSYGAGAAAPFAGGYGQYPYNNGYGNYGNQYPAGGYGTGFGTGYGNGYAQVPPYGGGYNNFQGGAFGGRPFGSRPFTEKSLSDVKSDIYTKKIKQSIKCNKVITFGRAQCKYCQLAKMAINATLQNATTQQGGKVDLYAFEYDRLHEPNRWFGALAALTGIQTVPQVFVCGELVGGLEHLQVALRDGTFQKYLAKCQNDPVVPNCARTEEHQVAESSSTASSWVYPQQQVGQPSAGILLQQQVQQANNQGWSFPGAVRSQAQRPSVQESADEHAGHNHGTHSA